MPEVNNTNNFINIPGTQKPEKPSGGQVSFEGKNANKNTTNLKDDPQAVTGRSLVRSAKKSKKAELEERVSNYTKEFLQDTKRATFLMDSVDTFKENFMSVEDATEASIKLAKAFGQKKIDSLKEIDGMGKFVADFCINYMSKFGCDLDKSIDLTVKTIDVISNKQ